MTTADKAAVLRRLHTDPELLRLVNVWDVTSARVVADVPGRRRRWRPRATRSPRRSACRTASRSAATRCSTSWRASWPRPTSRSPPTSRPATATRPRPTRRAIGVGVVGMNLEDQMAPLRRGRLGRRGGPVRRRGRGCPGLRAQRPHGRVPPRRRPASAARSSTTPSSAAVRSSTSVRRWSSCPVGVTEDEIGTLVDAFGAGTPVVARRAGRCRAGPDGRARRRPRLVRSVQPVGGTDGAAGPHDVRRRRRRPAGRLPQPRPRTGGWPCGSRRRCGP